MGIFMGSAMLPSSLVSSSSPEIFFSSWRPWSVSCQLELQHEAVSISGLAGKSKEQEQAVNGCYELH